MSGPKDSPAFLYRQLRDSPRFRERFSSRVIALTTGVGILTPPQNAARWERRQAEIDKSIVAESARWGDSRQSSLLKRSDWLAEMNWMRLTYWPQIHPIALTRFHYVALYSTSAAPAVLMSPAGGIVNPGTRVRLSGGAQIYYTTNGTDPIQPSGALAPGARAYTNTLPVTGAVEIRAQRLVGGKPTSTARGFFLLTSNVARPSVVVVSELNYRPETNEEEEFLEVWNVSSRQYAVLGGARISGAVDGAFVTGWILPPAGRALLVRNRSVFEARYGAGLPIAGEYAGQLSNQGEWIHALAPCGLQLSSFRYGTLPPWPGSADGGGRSLTLKQGGDGGDPANPLKWRPSIAVGGTPGSDDSIAFTGDPLADVDRDGLTSLSEYFIGSSDADATAGPDRTPSLSLTPEGSLSVSLIHSLGADRAAYEWDHSPDLQEWHVAEGWDVPKSVVEGGSERLKWTVPSQGAPTSFYRLRVMLP